MKNLILQILLTVFLSSFIACTNSPQEASNKLAKATTQEQEKDNFMQSIEELNTDFFKNYEKIEELLFNKLEKEGSEYFIQNDCYDLLGKFESTLKTYCQICEKLNTTNNVDLLTSYLHLNDTANVRKQFDSIKNGENAFIYQDFHKYQDAGKVLESKYLSIKYDQRVEEFANAVFSSALEIESFFEKEWMGLLPPKVRVILLYSDGPGPYNPNLNETYLQVKSWPLSSHKGVTGHIVHETFHLVNINLLEQKSDFEIDNEMHSFKFLDEGYAQLIESKFMNTVAKTRKIADDYSKEMVLFNSFDFKDLQTKWFELFSNPDVNIYHLACSFAFFLEDKYGAEKLKALFLPNTKISEKDWLEYVENYFESSLDELIEEWKQKVRSS